MKRNAKTSEWPPQHLPEDTGKRSKFHVVIVYFYTVLLGAVLNVLNCN